MRYLIDTDLIRCIAKEQPGWQRIVDRMRQVGFHRCEFSAVVFYEINVAADNVLLSQLEREALKRLATTFVTVEFDGIAAIHAARVKTWKNKRGKPSQRDAVDTMLAGHAIALGAVVVTNNGRDFIGVPELQVENWLMPHAG